MMFDLNKEREAFEALPQIKAILIGGEFYFSTLSMNYKPKNPQNENHLQCTYFLNGGWYAFQEKAKAQAVPEPHTHSVTLTCAELKEAFDFGAPDGEKINSK